ncbi:hypothetical protein BD310DRAFT_341726 [Dichomitus squalens]|uniref:N-acetyltransferase domain-containing protein n=1 Tax=Dichomitus squalens TaxID=114155 RepID=A0A4Q9Q033_9APHY|nr:hypothetical protein BD310DRAFT_341726 [Dichomitus squalens]
MAPPNVTIELIQKPTEPLAEEAVQLFASLVVGDPCMMALTGGDWSILPDLGRVLVYSLSSCPGVSHMFTARDETGALVGFTLFSLPGEPILPTQEKGRVSAYISKLSPEGRQYFAETMGKEVPQSSDEMFGIEGAERNAYWCSLAMVRADYQGRGVAKAMFELAYKEAAKTGAAVALTTTNIRNVPIYEKIGLKLYGERTFSSQWVEWTLGYFARDWGTGSHNVNIVNEGSQCTSTIMSH